MSVDEMRRNRRREQDRLGRKRRQLAQIAGQSTSLVPAAPIRRKLNELHQLGWSFEAIAAMNGVGTAAALNLIAAGASFRCERKFAPIADMPITLHVPSAVADTMWVPTLGATRRIRALLALGWRHEDISEHIGRCSHSIGGGTYLRTTAIDWRIIDATYNRMSGGRGASTRTAARARANGYIPPFGWRDIDDPAETPTGGRLETDEHVDPIVVRRILDGDYRLLCTPAEKTAVAAEWARLGRSLNDLERHTHWRVSRYYKKGAA